MCMCAQYIRNPLMIAPVVLDQLTVSVRPIVGRCQTVVQLRAF